MGLDIRVYTGIKKADAVKDDGEFDGEFFEVYNSEPFKDRSAPLVQDEVYSYLKFEGFPAGSYGGYNAWRNELARLAGYESAQDIWNGMASGQIKTAPFAEMINFSDCEGCIGQEIAKKLAKDFAEYEEKAQLKGQFFFGRYTNFKNAFESISENGAVVFA